MISNGFFEEMPGTKLFTFGFHSAAGMKRANGRREDEQQRQTNHTKTEGRKQKKKKKNAYMMIMEEGDDEPQSSFSRIGDEEDIDRNNNNKKRETNTNAEEGASVRVEEGVSRKKKLVFGALVASVAVVLLVATVIALAATKPPSPSGKPIALWNVNNRRERSLPIGSFTKFVHFAVLEDYDKNEDLDEVRKDFVLLQVTILASRTLVVVALAV